MDLNCTKEFDNPQVYDDDLKGISRSHLILVIKILWWWFQGLLSSELKGKMAFEAQVS